MRDAALVLVTGCVMFAVGSFYSLKTPKPPEQVVDLPAALAIRPPTYADGSLNPDYRDLAIAALQVAYDQMADALTEAQQHDAELHRGCVRWGGR